MTNYGEMDCEKRKAKLFRAPRCCVSFRKRDVRLTLAQNATPDELQMRAAELATNQLLYVYESPASIPNVAFIKGPYCTLPGQTPTFKFKAKVACASIKIFANNCLIDGKVLQMFRIVTTLFLHAILLDLSKPADVHKFGQIFAEQSEASHERAVERQRNFVAAREASTFEERSSILEPYRSLFRILNPPAVANVFLEDRVFARLRVAGYNPMSLFRADENTFQFPFAPEQIIGLQNDRFQTALAEKRIYALDFKEFANFAEDPTSHKKLVACQALFLRPLGACGDLTPLAIRLVNCDEWVLSPYVRRLTSRAISSDTKWDIAKHALNICDAVHHELVAHLGRTHLLIEAFVAATMRQLPSSHPVHALLTPHFEGTVFINETASKELVAPGGDVDRIFAGDIADVMAWCSRQLLNLRFNQCFPHVELEKRGVNDPALNFPYRDDAKAHFDALLVWVTGYLRYFYKSDADVQADTELAAWAEEITDEARGRVKDFGDEGDGKIVTLEYLIQAITFIIFTASVQHAAVNFPQLSLMSYAPALAGALWGPIPTPGELCSLNTWKDLLPPTKTAMEQIDILGVIGAVYYTKLGHYNKKQFVDPSNSCCSWPQEIKTAHTAYMKKLKEIDAIIGSREKNNDLKYDYLRPGKIPQSINI